MVQVDCRSPGILIEGHIDKGREGDYAEMVH